MKKKRQALKISGGKSHCYLYWERTGLITLQLAASEKAMNPL